jgi:hypothetical protein
MRSHIGIYYMVGGQPAGEPWFINELDAHPGVEESLGKILAGIGAVVAAIASSGAGAALGAALGAFTAGGDTVAVQRNAEHWFGDNGTVGNLPTPVDTVDFWFRAWTEDDWLGNPLATVAPMDPTIQDLGENRFDRGDDHWYEHGFRFPLRQVPVGTYALGCGAKDDGWYYDVAVISTCVINIIPDPKSQPGFSAPADRRPTLKRTDNDTRPLVRLTPLEAARRA